MPLSFHADPACKAAILEQLEAQSAKGRLAPVIVGERSISLGTIGRLPEPGTAAAIGLPEPVLDVGFFLYDGFPETVDDTREFIQTRRKLIDTIPVGVDFGDFAGHYCRGLLDEPELEFRRLIHTPAVGHLRYEICEALAVDPRGAFLDEDLQRRVNSRLGDILGVIPYQYQTTGQVDPAVRKTQKALEILEAVCRLPHDPNAAGDAADFTLYALFADIDAEHSFEEGTRRQRKLFVRLLKQAGHDRRPRRGT
ncbi:MAG: hypothetical protein JNL73_15010 [Anaerolineales bacterium]|nr:hypothetical protein [Anaerolineales bacterium]